MTNPHIIVGENGRCLCGTYGAPGDSFLISCGDVIGAIEHLNNFGVALVGEQHQKDAKILEAVTRPLIQDRPVE